MSVMGIPLVESMTRRLSCQWLRTAGGLQRYISLGVKSVEKDDKWDLVTLANGVPYCTRLPKHRSVTVISSELHGVMASRNRNLLTT